MAYRTDYEINADELLMYEARLAEVEQRLKAITALRDKCAADLREKLARNNLKSVTVNGKRITFRTEKRWKGPVEIMLRHAVGETVPDQLELLTIKERDYSRWCQALDDAGLPVPPEVKYISITRHSITAVDS